MPVFFVVLGASLNVRTLVSDPSNLGSAVALIVGMMLVHVLAARAIRATVSTALIVTAQLGVPAAVVNLGLAERVITRPRGRDHPRGAVSLGLCAAGTAMAKRARTRAGPHPTRAPQRRKSRRRRSLSGRRLREPSGDGVARRRRILAGDLEPFDECPESFDEL